MTCGREGRGPSADKLIHKMRRDVLCGLVCAWLVTALGCAQTPRAVVGGYSNRSILAAAPCDITAKSDSIAILGTTRAPRALSLRPPLPRYMTQFRPGAAYFTYKIQEQRCKLAHLDVRWNNRLVPLAVTLPGGNLQSILLTRTGGQPTLEIVDRWGRRLARGLPSPPSGITLWGGAGPLHASINDRALAATPDIFVGANGPKLYSFGQPPWPPEWDVRAHRFVESPGVYAH